MGGVAKGRKGLAWEAKAAAEATEAAYASGKGMREVRAEVEDGVYREFKSLAASRGLTVKRAIGLVLAQEVDRAFEVRVRSWQAKLNAGLGGRSRRPGPAAGEDPVLVPTAEKLEALLDENSATYRRAQRKIAEAEAQVPLDYEAAGAGRPREGEPK